MFHDEVDKKAVRVRAGAIALAGLLLGKRRQQALAVCNIGSSTRFSAEVLLRLMVAPFLIMRRPSSHARKENEDKRSFGFTRFAKPFVYSINNSNSLRATDASSGETAALSLESPFKLSAALKFGLVFLALNLVGALAQRNFGPASFYFVSVAGGLLSSTSSIASAATLIAHHEISAATGVNGIILSSLTSISINVPLIRSMTKEAAFRRKVCFGLVIVAVVGLVGVGLNEVLFFVPRN